MARSTPDSATARVWATVSWLLAMRGSVVARTEKATMSVVSMTIAISASGRAAPRSSVSI